MTDPYVPAAAVRRYTKKQTKPAQCRVLDAQKIPYTKAADGEPLVLPSNLPGFEPGDTKDREPRWSEIQ